MQRSTLLISASPVIPLCSLHNVMLLQLMCDSLGFEVNSDLTHTDYSFSKWCTLLHVYTNIGNYCNGFEESRLIMCCYPDAMLVGLLVLAIYALQVGLWSIQI